MNMVNIHVTVDLFSEGVTFYEGLNSTKTGTFYINEGEVIKD